jgi:hypothetical protein
MKLEYPDAEKNILREKTGINRCKKAVSGGFHSPEEVGLKGAFKP